MKPHLDQLGLSSDNAGVQIGQTNASIGSQIVSTSPVDGATIGATGVCSKDDYEKVIAAATEAGKAWRNVPAPQRGEVVRLYGEALRAHKDALGALVSYEMGKSYQEGLGEVQEMIDICDFAKSRYCYLLGKPRYKSMAFKYSLHRYKNMGQIIS